MTQSVMSISEDILAIELFQAKKPPDMLCEFIVNFSMSWDWLFLTRTWIAINVVPGTVAV